MWAFTLYGRFFKKIKQALGIKNTSLANPELVFALTGAKIGEVSLVKSELKTLIDTNVLKNKDCFEGCGVAKTTLRINTQDLIKITHAQILDLTDPRS